MTRTAHRPALRRLLASSFCVAVLAAPATADWLVIRDGSVIETRGVWEVENQQVVFTRANGTLSALRLREVDLEASRQLTLARQAGAQKPDETAESESAEPRWTLTDDDIPAAAPGPEEIVIEPLIGAEGFELAGVRETIDATGNSLRVEGTLINTADIYASEIRLRVRLVSPEDGGTLDTTAAVLGTSDLPPGTATHFSASFINVSPGLGVVQVEVVLAAEEDDERPRFDRSALRGSR